MKRIVVVAALAALAAAACGHARTTAASQPSGAFDAAKSDPKALATVDAALTAMGGYDKWQALKELKFELVYHADGKVEGWFKHSWDRWNGRHHFQMADAKTLGGDPAKIAWIDIKYDIFDSGKTPYGTYQGQVVADDDVRKYIGVAKEALMNHAYFLVMMYKLRDPGVHLADGGTPDPLAGAEDLCKPSCAAVKVTFDPAVGTDTWQVDFNTDTHLPQMIEKIVPQGRAVYRIDAWADAGGLKWPSKLTNVGNKGEFYEFNNIAVGEPKDAEYSQPVDRSQGDSFGNNRGH